MLCTERRVKIRQIPDPRLPLHTYSNSYFHTCHTAPLHFAQSRKVSTNWSRAEELEEGEEGETKQNRMKMYRLKFKTSKEQEQKQKELKCSAACNLFLLTIVVWRRTQANAMDINSQVKGNQCEPQPVTTCQGSEV